MTRRARPGHSTSDKDEEPSDYWHRQTLDAIRYRVDNGVKWWRPPADFPPWKRVYAFFRRWWGNQLIRELHDRRRERVRKTEGRNTGPTASVIDSQSVKADAYGLAARRSLPTTEERAPPRAVWQGI